MKVFLSAKYNNLIEHRKAALLYNTEYDRSKPCTI